MNLDRAKARLRRSRHYPRLLRLKKIPFYLRDRLLRSNKKPDRFCFAPWNESVVLCDGTVVCSCADPFATMRLGCIDTMRLGNVEQASFLSIWQGEPYRRLRRAVLRGAEHVYLCRTCCFACARPESCDEPVFPEVPPRYPRQLHVEPTVRCNLRCPACGVQLARAARTRTDMPFETFQRLLDEVGPHIERLCFYDYGEAFLHPRAIDMLRHARGTNPALHIECSTNGHYFRTEEACRAVIEAGVNRIIFSVDGASQETYSQYRVGGRFDLVVGNMRRLIETRRAMGADRPFVMWRYILFNWNDSDEEMDKARDLAKEIGVDALRWMITDHPEDGYSRRFAPGTAALESIRQELDGQSGAL